jgi:hypothetical protein
MTTLLALLAAALSLIVTKDEVRKLLDAGISDQTIIEYIRNNGPSEPLSVDEVTELKEAGASDAVLKAMLDASRTSDAVTPSHPSRDSYTDTPRSYYSYNYYHPYPYSYYYGPSYYYAPYAYPRYYYPRSYYSYPYRYSHPYRYSTPYRYTRPYPHSVSPYRHQSPPVRQPVPRQTSPRQGGNPYRR